MPMLELSEQPSVYQTTKPPLSAQKTVTTREKITLLLFILFSVFIVILFLKVIEYEVVHTFHWFHHPVQIEPAWY